MTEIGDVLGNGIDEILGIQPHKKAEEPASINVEVNLTSENLKEIADDVSANIESKVSEQVQDGIVKKVSKKVLENDFARFMSAVAEKTSESIASDILSETISKVQPTIEKYMADTYGPIQRKIIISVNDLPALESDEAVHDAFDEIMAYMVFKEPVALSGPAGCGKNVLCKQIASALNLEFYYTNAVTQEYALKGFTDAMGVFHETQFYKAFKNGGLFMLDEMDASIPEVLIILNGAIANGYFDFPAPIGRTDAHHDFRVIAAMNTFGSGASYQYIGRNQLDGASLDRFALVRMTYDPKVEEKIARGDGALLAFIRDFRNTADKNGLNVILSYRAIQRMAKVKDTVGIEKALKAGIIKGMEHEDLNLIVTNMSVRNEYTQACSQILKNMTK